MSKLWACEVTKWGPLLVFQDADESFKMMCSCTHPHNRRVQGRPEIVTSLTLSWLVIGYRNVIVIVNYRYISLHYGTPLTYIKQSLTCSLTVLEFLRQTDWPSGWNRIFSSSTLPTLQITDERVLVTSGDMAIVVCKEDSCLQSNFCSQATPESTNSAIGCGAL